MSLGHVSAAGPKRGARAALLAAAIAASSPGWAADELSSGFTGRWYAQGDCSDGNKVPGAVVIVSPSALQGHGFACTFSKIEEAAEGDGKRADLHRICATPDKTTEAEVRLYLVPSQVFGEALVTVNQDGSFLTLYKRCP